MDPSRSLQFLLGPSAFKGQTRLVRHRSWKRDPTPKDLERSPTPYPESTGLCNDQIFAGMWGVETSTPRTGWGQWCARRRGKLYAATRTGMAVDLGRCVIETGRKGVNWILSSLNFRQILAMDDTDIASILLRRKRNYSTVSGSGKTRNVVMFRSSCRV